jgi:hypothetical protein
MISSPQPLLFSRLARLRSLDLLVHACGWLSRFTIERRPGVVYRCVHSA